MYSALQKIQFRKFYSASTLSILPGKSLCHILRLCGTHFSPLENYKKQSHHRRLNKPTTNLKKIQKTAKLSIDNISMQTPNLIILMVDLILLLGCPKSMNGKALSYVFINPYII